MPEGSLAVRISNLQTALSGIAELLGTGSDGGSPGSGLAGASASVTISPADLVVDFEGSFTTQVSGMFEIEAAAEISGISNSFNDLQALIADPPTDALSVFEQLIEQAGAVFENDLIDRLQQALDAVRSISEGVPQNRAGVISELLDQILRVLGSLEGPEGIRIQGWINSLAETQRVLAPLIEQAQSLPDPAAVVVEVFRRALFSSLEVFGLSRIQRLVTFLDDFPGEDLSTDVLNELNASLDAGSATLDLVIANAGATWPQFRDTVGDHIEALRVLKDHLRPMMSVIRRVATAKIFQPGALEAFLRKQLEDALDVQISEVQKIDDPFNELLDRIDAAIEGINLSEVRSSVLDFFENTRNTIEQVNLPSLGDTLGQQLEPVEIAVAELQRGVTGLLGQIEGFFDNMTGQLHSLAGSVGEFQSDGTFQYHLAVQLEQLLNSSRFAIGGDPDNPGASSVAGTLNQLQSALDQFLSQLTELLTPVEAQINSVRDTAVSGIDDFTSFLSGLDVPALIETLRQKVQEICDALAPIDFGFVVDPVVEEIDETADKLRQIDPESLNDILRSALQVALDVVISIDFTATISSPLSDQFEQVKAIPQQALDQLQARYEQAISILDELSPSQLLEALFAAFDTIERAVSSLNVAGLLQPLDDLHEEYLQQPLAQLKPSVLMQPVSDAFSGFLTVFEEINGSNLVAPLTTSLDTLKTRVAELDVTGWIDDLLAAVEKVRTDIGEIRPSVLFQPLVADLQRLEGELDRFKPSVVFQPAVALAAPLLQFLEGIQQQTIDALHGIYQAPLALLDRMQPEALTAHIVQLVNGILESLDVINLPARFNTLKGKYFDLNVALESDVIQAKADLAVFIDPQRQLGEIVDAYNELIVSLEAVKQNVVMPDLSGLYDELRERLLGMLPGYARELLDPETFKRLMRLADPTRFLEELDARFETIKAKLLPISPLEIVAELDAAYDSVLALVDNLDITDSLNQVAGVLDSLKSTVNLVRVDFVAADIDRAVNDVWAVAEALNPAVFFDELDAIHHEVELVVNQTLPSEMLGGLQAMLDQVQGLVSSVNPRTVLAPPIDAAWETVTQLLGEVNFTIILSPLVEKLDELEEQFTIGLQRTETAFDQMLGAGRGALGGSGSVSVSVSVGGSI